MEKIFEKIILDKTVTNGIGRPWGYNALKDEIYSLDKETQDKIYNELRECFRDFGKLCNITISSKFAVRYLFPGEKETPSLKKLGINTGYKPLLEAVNIPFRLNGQALSQIYGISGGHFRGEHGKKLFGKGESSLPNHRLDGSHPIYFSKNGIKILFRDKKFFVAYALFSKTWAKQESIPNWVAFPIYIKKKDKSMYSQLEKMMNGEYKIGQGKIARNSKKKLISQICVSFEKQNNLKLNPDIIMGIDLGVNSPACVHIRQKETDGLKWENRIGGDGRKILDSRNKIRKEIQRIIGILKEGGLDDNFKEKYKKELRILRKKEGRLIKTLSQKMAKQIVNIAIQNCAGTWQLEKLGKDLKDKNSWLALNWAPGVLLDAIKWQAKQVGAEIILINPQYTSQRCSKCGHIDPENRPKKEKGASFFQCIKCGYNKNADKNAARNISTFNIEKIIEEHKSLVSYDTDKMIIC